MNHSLSTPVIVLSPTVRAGTTLVQRLLCSAPNALVYGDLVGQEMEFFAKYASVKEQMMGFQAVNLAPVLRAVLAGDTDDFITSLAPEPPRYLAGFKDAALAWLPEARWIWVERDPSDCFRSAKAAGMVQGAADAAHFARAALAARAAFAPLASQALLLDFQTMTADPAGTIRRLEAHTGAQGISGRVFSVRVNLRSEVMPSVMDGCCPLLKTPRSSPSWARPSAGMGPRTLAFRISGAAFPCTGAMDPDSLSGAWVREQESRPPR